MKICYKGKFKVDYKIIIDGERFVIPVGTSCIITEDHSMYEDTILGNISQSEWTRALVFQDFSQINENDSGGKRFYKAIRVRRDDIEKISEFDKKCEK